VPGGAVIANSVAIRACYEDAYRPTNLVKDQTGRLTGYRIEGVVPDPEPRFSGGQSSSSSSPTDEEQ
jgi:hypothetical protein